MGVAGHTSRYSDVTTPCNLAYGDPAGAGLFAFTGTAILSKATAGAEPNVVWAALGNGFALAIASEVLAWSWITLIVCLPPEKPLLLLHPVFIWHIWQHLAKKILRT